MYRKLFSLLVSPWEACNFNEIIADPVRISAEDSPLVPSACGCELSLYAAGSGMRIRCARSFGSFRLSALLVPLLFALTARAANTHTPAAEVDRVSDLPGLEALKSGLFSG